MHPGIANFKQLLSEKLAKLYDVCFQSHEHFDYSVWDNTAVCDEVSEMWGEV